MTFLGRLASPWIARIKKEDGIPSPMEATAVTPPASASSLHMNRPTVPVSGSVFEWHAWATQNINNILLGLCWLKAVDQTKA